MLRLLPQQLRPRRPTATALGQTLNSHWAVLTELCTVATTQPDHRQQVPMRVLAWMRAPVWRNPGETPKIGYANLPAAGLLSTARRGLNNAMEPAWMLGFRGGEVHLFPILFPIVAFVCFS